MFLDNFPFWFSDNIQFGALWCFLIVNEINTTYAWNQSYLVHSEVDSNDNNLIFPETRNYLITMRSGRNMEL